VTIALLDVHYGTQGAHAACVLAASWVDATPVAGYCVAVRQVEAYEPGHFYRRELPCLLQVLDTLPCKPSVAVVDGYVWLPQEARAGLGLHLHHALGLEIPVVGIAKTAFVGTESSPLVTKIFRGGSKRPLFVSAVGVELSLAGGWVQSMAGAHRIPSLVAAVDRLARAGRPTLPQAHSASSWSA
jgi:deoxyribonuclease V